MNDRESRRYDMFTEVDAFGNDYLKDLSPDSKGAKCRAAVAEVMRTTPMRQRAIDRPMRVRSQRRRGSGARRRAISRPP